MQSLRPVGDYRHTDFGAAREFCSGRNTTLFLQEGRQGRMRLLRFRRARNREFTLGNQARDARRWHAAVVHYERAVAAEPGNFAVWVQYGHALKESGDATASEAAYRKALSLAPEVADTYLQLGHVLKIQGRTEEAASAYLDALTLEPTLHFASFELFNLGWSVANLDRSTIARLKRGLRDKYPRRQRPIPSGAPSIAFDVSDLVHYFMRARVPTGIQRVQMNVVASLLRKPKRDFDLAIACFSANNDCWIEMPPDQFLEITGLAVSGGKFDDPDWRAALTDLYALLAVGEPLEFRPGAILIDMGTPWLRKNYFLMLRCSKAQFGVRYISFVHDCIPVLTPQHCAREHTQDFTSWILGVFYHADGFLVNSNATATDLKRIARRLGHSAPVPAVIRLDASFSFDRHVGNDDDRLDCIVERHAFDRTGFVLFVSTIESRKNHAMAFDAWLSLIKIRGFRRTPALVCVGNLGWLNDATMERLTSNRLLKRKVLILSNVSDAALVTLYRRCLFTLYPSSYEGWGLPITESLCHGKVPLTTRVSSLPEAGGDFAEYFDLESERDFVEKLLRLIDDRGYRELREAMIRRHFRPRSWTEVADEIIARVTEADAVPAARPASQRNEIWPLPIEIGRYFSMSRNLETTVWPGMISGEMYRMGHGWGPPSDWGVWLKRDHADIAFSLPEAAKGGYAIYLGLRAKPEESTNFEITVVGTASRLAGNLAAGEDRWVIVSFDTGALRTDEVQIRLSAAGSCEVAGMRGEWRAARFGVIGFYVCARADTAANDRFFELLTQNRLDTLSGRPIDEQP